MLALDVRAFRGRSVGPTFNADLRKSLFAHFALGDVVDDVDDDNEITFVGDSNFGGCGGNALLVYTFCFDGDAVVLFGDGTGGLFDLDFSLFNAFLIELLRDIDGDFDTELSLDDFVELFSGDLSIALSILFSGELSLESFSFLLDVLYLDKDVTPEPLLNRV